MNIDWACPFQLISPTMGTLLLNTPDANGRIYRLNPKACVGRRNIRAATDDVPNGDGEIFHDRYASGSEMQLAIQLWDGGNIACYDVLVDMYDDLRGFLWSLLRPDDDGGRLIWTPNGKDARMLDAARLLTLNDPEEDSDTLATQITCVLDSPFPYAISLAQDDVTINGAGTLTNAGNVDFWPVIKMYADGGTITNNTTGYEIAVGSGCLGAGTYIEMDTFRNTMYVDGDQANAKPCLDVITSEFFPLIPGDNSITTDVSCHFLVNDAWA